MGPGVAVADLTVIEVDQLAQRDDPLQVGVAESKIIEPTRAVTTEDVVELGDHPFFAEGLVDLRFQPGAEPAQLGPIADQFAQLSQRWRRHPGLRQPPKSEKVSEQGGVTDVVLHAAVLVAGDAQRVRQMQPGAALGDATRSTGVTDSS